VFCYARHREFVAEKGTEETGKESKVGKPESVVRLDQVIYFHLATTARRIETAFRAEADGLRVRRLEHARGGGLEWALLLSSSNTFDGRCTQERKET